MGRVDERKQSVWQRGRGRNPPSSLAILHVQGGQLFVQGGWVVGVYVVVKARGCEQKEERKVLS
jgi:hypothetical protein